MYALHMSLTYHDQKHEDNDQVEPGKQAQIYNQYR